MRSAKAATERRLGCRATTAESSPERISWMMGVILPAWRRGGLQKFRWVWGGGWWWNGSRRGRYPWLCPPRSTAIRDRPLRIMDPLWFVLWVEYGRLGFGWGWPVGFWSSTQCGPLTSKWIINILNINYRSYISHQILNTYRLTITINACKNDDID